jgi:FecR-like protein
MEAKAKPGKFMVRCDRRLGLIGVAAALALALTPFPSSAASKIGVASAVKNDVRVGGRNLSVGGDINAQERVVTGAASTAQLLFLDQTNLDIGPNSEVTLDRFVYDPNRGTGNVVVNASKGALRFVSGSQRPGTYTIKTPVATVGVRGSVGDIFVGNGFLILINVTGSFQVTIAGKTYVLDKAGQALIVRQGGVVQGPFVWDSSLINVVGDIPHPLFGYSFLGDPRYIQNFDRSQVLDQLLSMGGPPPPPPPPIIEPPPPPPDPCNALIICGDAARVRRR